MRLFRTNHGILLETEERWFRLPDERWADLLTNDDLPRYLSERVAKLPTAAAPDDSDLLSPVEQQEVWAAGVTYFRSKTARMEESEKAGGGSFYDRVYEAQRPELFFKATAHRVAAPGQAVHIRSDSRWNVPEPELTLVLTPAGRLIGYTAGNDMSSRDIEGENPLYLPQAKVYTRSCALGPGILVTSEPLPNATTIKLKVERKGAAVFTDETTLAQLKRPVGVLAEYLFRENSFPAGCFLMTGTGIVPPDSFTLEQGDVIAIGIDGVGELRNSVD